MNQALGFLADMFANHFAAGGRVEDGEVDVGVGVRGVEEAAEGDGSRGLPEAENTIHVEKVVEEAAVLVPALAGTNTLQDPDKAWQILVDGLELAEKEGTSAFEEVLE